MLQRLKKTQEGIKQLSGELQTQREIQQMDNIDTDDNPVEGASDSIKKVSTKKGVPFNEKFTDEAIEEIKLFPLLKLEDYVSFGDFAVKRYYKRGEFLKDEYKKNIIKREDWVDWIYKINKEEPGNLKRDTLEYNAFKMGVNKYGIQQQQFKEQQKEQQQQLKKERKEQQQSRGQQSPEIQKVSGEGYGSSHHDSHICPSNIINDISRLEVLMGGKRAGNNSVEITNEAFDICRRLFQGGIIDVHTYRELLDELMDGIPGEFSGYYSD